LLIGDSPWAKPLSQPNYTLMGIVTPILMREPVCVYASRSPYTALQVSPPIP
jgi:hypothetical protein